MSKAIQQQECSLRSIILKRIHILEWLPKYTKGDFISDFITGLTVGLTMMPQSIAYASLAGLPAQYGLYTAFVGSFTYVIFGTIKEVSIGPTSLMALMVFSYTEGLNVDYVILLTLLVGCVEFLMGLLKLGFLVDFISPCVISGFTSAMSISICVSQLKNILGLKHLKNHGFIDVIKQICARLGDIQMGDTVLGVSCILFLYGFKKLAVIETKNGALKKTLWFLGISKNAIIVLLTSILGFYFYEYRGGSPFLLSGSVVSGLPQISIPSFQTQVGNETVGFTDMVATLGSSILVLPVAAVLANVAIAKAFASGVVVDATQEMMTLGLCNIFGSFVQAMPSCGAFTRSAVASSSGVRTPLQGLYSGTIILLSLSFLTPYFYYIPRATLGAVLIVAIMTLFDYEIFPKLWRCNKFDFFLTIATLIAGSLYGVEAGMMFGGVANLLILLKLWARPRIITEIRLDNQGNNYMYIKPEIGLYYPAIDYLCTTIAEAHNSAHHLPIVIDCANIIRIDFAGCQTIENLIKTYKKKNVSFMIKNVNSEILGILQNTIDFTNLEECTSLSNISSESSKNDCDLPLLAAKKEPERKMSYYDNV